MKNINIDNIVINVWRNVKLDFHIVFDEILYYISVLSAPIVKNDMFDNKEILNKKITILNNIIKQRKLRNVIIDGIILSDLQYSTKFFNTNLYLLIQQCLQQANPQYKSSLYHFIDNKLYCLFPDKYVAKIIKKFSTKLKSWIITESKNELVNLKKNIIYI